MSDKPIKVIRTVKRQNTGKEGIKVKETGEIVYDDSWMFCKLCHSDFPIEGYPVCADCLEEYKNKINS